MKSKYLLFAALGIIIILAVFLYLQNEAKTKIEKDIASLEERNKRLQKDYESYQEKALAFKREADSALLVAKQYHADFVEKENQYNSIASKYKKARRNIEELTDHIRVESFLHRTSDESLPVVTMKSPSFIDSVFLIPIDNIDKANNLFIERDEFKEEKDKLNEIKMLLTKVVEALQSNIGFKDQLIAANDSIIANRNDVIVNKDLIIKDKNGLIKKAKRGKLIAWIAAVGMAVVAILK